MPLLGRDGSRSGTSYFPVLQPKFSQQLGNNIPLRGLFCFLAIVVATSDYNTFCEVTRLRLSPSFAAAPTTSESVLADAMILGLILGLIRGTQGPVTSLFALKRGMQGITG